MYFSCVMKHWKAFFIQWSESRVHLLGWTGRSSSWIRLVTQGLLTLPSSHSHPLCINSPFPTPYKLSEMCPCTCISFLFFIIRWINVPMEEEKISTQCEQPYMWAADCRWEVCVLSCRILPSRRSFHWLLHTGGLLKICSDAVYMQVKFY